MSGPLVLELIAEALLLPEGFVVVDWSLDRRGDVVVLVQGDGVLYDGGRVEPSYQQSQFDGHVACVNVQQAPGA